MNAHLKVIVSALAILTAPAPAVIVAGASGGGNTANNTSAAQFQGEYGVPMPVYENVISYSDASGIYLGYDAATKDVWVLTARHVNSSATQGNTVTIDGKVYTRQPGDGDGFGFLPGGDLRLVRYRRTDLAVPSLPAVRLSSTVVSPGTALFMAGYGKNRVQDASVSALTSDAVSVTVGTGYNWSGTNIKRWGVNQVEAEFLNALESTGPVTGPTGTISLGPYSTICYMTDFDAPSSGSWLTSNEAQGSLGDSGGGAFYHFDGQWYLSGIFTSVAGFGGQAANSSAFGNLSLLTDVSSYHTAIQTALNQVTLIPEPEAPFLMLLTSVTWLSRRRRTRI